MHRRVAHSVLTTTSKPKTLADAHHGSVSGSHTKNGVTRRRRHNRLFLSRALFSGSPRTKKLGSIVKRFLLVGIALVLLFIAYVVVFKLPRYKLNDLRFGLGLGYYAPVLPWNSHYRVEEAHERTGDRSNAYAILRKEIDAHLQHEDVFAEQLAVVNSRKQKYQVHPMVVDTSTDRIQPVYDVYNCPPEPPEGYPFVWKTVDILRAWNPDETTPPPVLHQSICVFDFTKDYDKAMAYREASLPFLVVNDPAMTKTAVRWSLPGYMKRLFGLRNLTHKTSFSETNHFMFYKEVSKQLRKVKDNTPEDWKQPTKEYWMNYDNFVTRANVTTEHAGPASPHWYMQMTACGLFANDGSCSWDATEFFNDELPFFQPHSLRPSNELYLYHPEYRTSGIICRFGMEGIIYESHFDRESNSLALISGNRRFILSPPDQCKNQALFPYGHPSARHSAVDWSNPDMDKYPEFANSLSTEFVLQAGELLYLPSNWFHFIVSCCYLLLLVVVVVVQLASRFREHTPKSFFSRYCALFLAGELGFERAV